MSNPSATDAQDDDRDGEACRACGGSGTVLPETHPLVKHEDSMVGWHCHRCDGDGREPRHPTLGGNE